MEEDLVKAQILHLVCQQVEVDLQTFHYMEKQEVINGIRAIIYTVVLLSQEQEEDQVIISVLNIMEDMVEEKQVKGVDLGQKEMEERKMDQ